MQNLTGHTLSISDTENYNGIYIVLFHSENLLNAVTVVQPTATPIILDLNDDRIEVKVTYREDILLGVLAILKQNKYSNGGRIAILEKALENNKVIQSEMPQEESRIYIRSEELTNRLTIFGISNPETESLFKELQGYYFFLKVTHIPRFNEISAFVNPNYNLGTVVDYLKTKYS